MRVSEAIVESLVAEDIEYYFTVYAEQITGFIVDSETRGRPRSINASYEPGAGFMGLVYSRVKRSPGLCVFTGGPGVLGAVNPVAMAYVESDPLVVIATTPPRDLAYRNAIHAFPNDTDQIEVFRSITKRCYRVTKPAEAGNIVSKAFTTALSGRPGPVYIEIPADVLRENVEDYSHLKIPVSRPVPSDADVDEVIKRILRSERPVILAGRGISISGAERELVEFAELLDIPVCTTVMGKGVIRPDHPLYGGIAAGKMGDPVAEELLEKADLVLAIGVRFSQMGTGRYSMKVGGELIHINVSEDEFGRVFKPSLAIVSDAAAFLRKAIIRARERVGGRFGRGSAELLKKLWISYKQDLPKPRGHMIEPWEVVKALREIFSEDTIFVCDVGAHRIETFTMPIYKPRTYITTTSYASMGIGVPGAIAAKLAEKEREVVGLVGDGGFLMTGLEVVTAVRYRIPVIIVVFNDSSYRVLRIYEKAEYGTEFTYKLPNISFSELARSLGAHGVRIEDRKELRRGIEDAASLAKDRPVVIDIVVNPEAIPLPMARLYGARYIDEMKKISRE
ncbi:MAG: thiamine pyrophosphate-binding protein [Sulfolobales archaeon]